MAACCDHADLICFPELFAWTGLDAEQKRKAAEPVGGKVCSFMAKLASEYSVNILTPILERENDRIYNSMAWLDRKGKVLGIYRKVFPTDYEMAEGIYPGALDFKVFNTELGPIGCCICFDLNFREVIERLAAQHSRLVICPTMFDGLTLMRAWAKLYRMYFVSVAAASYAAVVDPLGTVLVEPWSYGPILSASLNLDYVVLHTDYNKDKFLPLKKAYGSAVEIKRLDTASAALLMSCHSSKTAEEIASEFDLELEEELLQA